MTDEPLTSPFVNDATPLFMNWSDPISTPITDLNAAIARIREERYQPTTMIVSAQTYRTLDWYLRKTHFRNRYVLFPFLDRIAKRRRAITRSLRWLRWEVEEYGLRAGLRVWWFEDRR